MVPGASLEAEEADAVSMPRWLIWSAVAGLKLKLKKQLAVKHA